MLVPLMADMTGQPVVCVGAGPVARNKVVPLMQAGAIVTVIAPEIDEGLTAAQTTLRRPYQTGDLDQDLKVKLVVAATGIVAVDHRVAVDAVALGIWCVRSGGAGDMTVPAVLRQGGLTIALVTGAPALTRQLRQRLHDRLDPHWGPAATTLAALRDDPDVQAALSEVIQAERRRRWHAAVDAALAGDPSDITLRNILIGN